MAEVFGNPVDELITLFDTYASSTYDEGVTLRQHCLQAAAIASSAGSPDHLIAAALLHDIGHLLQACAWGEESYLADDWNHDVVARDWLEPRFGEAVAAPVGEHVAAKRWLCFAEPDYFARLSEASKASLRAQGGQFDEAEAARWHATSGAMEAIQLRRWDDEAKVPDASVAPFTAYIALLEGLAR